MKYTVINPAGAVVFNTMQSAAGFMRKERRKGDDDAGENAPVLNKTLPLGAQFVASSASGERVFIDARRYVLAADVRAETSAYTAGNVTRAEYEELKKRVEALENK